MISYTEIIKPRLFPNVSSKVVGGGGAVREELRISKAGPEP